MTFTNKKIPLDDLTTSKVNVRALAKNKNVQQLAADIASQGLIQPLTVFKVGGKYQVDAGNRRLAALNILAESGKWSGDVACRVIKSTTTTEDRAAISFSENNGQLPMHPLDRMRVLTKFVKQSGNLEAVAARFGLEPLYMQKLMRLTRLALPIRAALASGKLSEDKAFAFCSTVDCTAQMEVFERLSHYTDAAQIRKMLHTSTGGGKTALTTNHRLFRFIGEDVYTDNGGVIEGDLFSEENNRKVDAKLVRTLAQSHLSRLAQEAQIEDGAEWFDCDVNANWIPKKYEVFHGQDCPVALGVFAHVAHFGRVEISTVIRVSDWEKWESDARANSDDPLEQIEPDAPNTETEKTPEIDAENQTKKPSRPMDKCAEDALTLALQNKVKGNFEAAFDVTLHTMLCEVTNQRRALSAHFSTSYGPEIEALQIEIEGDGMSHSVDLWAVLDSWTTERKQAIFALIVAGSIRANNEGHALDRPAPSKAAKALGQRVGLDMRIEWDTASRFEYLGKMTKHDLLTSVLPASEKPTGDFSKAEKSVVVDQAMAVLEWVPAYFEGLTSAETNVYSTTLPPLEIAAE